MVKARFFPAIHESTLMKAVESHLQFPRGNQLYAVPYPPRQTVLIQFVFSDTSWIGIIVQNCSSVFSVIFSSWISIF